MFEKVLVANRGEIAIRIMRTLREMGIASVAVYSELDRDALHVGRADEAYLLGGPTAAESYLNVERILEVCRESGAQAVHPGYGFLAENAPFAKACEDAGITFIGPPASAIEAMGSKTRARELMKAAGVPIVPGTTDPVATVDDARRIIDDDIGFPVAVKAAGGGGGKGFRVALDESDLEAAFEGAARDGEYFFLEMNTRVQVEHCVTEMTTGVDIVREGILAAAGEKLTVAQDDVVLRGHAIECRINAEDASKKFAPAPGRITTYREPAGPGVRVDSGVGPGSEITPMYDPMVAKLIVWDLDREHATRRMVRALREYEIGGLKTLIPFHLALLQTEQWANGETCRDLLEDKEWLKTLAFPKAEQPKGDGGEPEATVEQAYTVEVSGRKFDVKVIGPPFAGGGAAVNGAVPPEGRKPRRAQRADSGGGAGADELVSPLQGNMWKVLVEAGQTVEEGQLVCIIEAMKMENEITAHKAGVIEQLSVKEGDAISSGATIAVIKSES
jgi:acetyl/propionyl-CoA carboxylase alpha subunit